MLLSCFRKRMSDGKRVQQLVGTIQSESTYFWETSNNAWIPLYSMLRMLAEVINRVPAYSFRGFASKQNRRAFND